MHFNQLLLMNSLLAKHKGKRRTVLDVGSYDVNGTFRRTIRRHRLRYLGGVDIVPGPNVDFVVSESGRWLDVVGQRADIVISGSTMEHVRRPWEWIQHVRELMRSGGLCIVIAPFRWPIHEHPVDCWRVLPDGMAALLESAALEVVATGLRKTDTYGVGLAT